MTSQTGSDVTKRLSDHIFERTRDQDDRSFEDYIPEITTRMRYNS
jgi:hypothetical protein